MSIESLVTLLESAGFNVFLGEADDGTVCPYVTLTNISHPNFGADNRTYVKTTSLQIRLVESEVHDWSLIATLEGALDSAEIFYESEDLRVPSEHICETIYEINFYGGNENA